MGWLLNRVGEQGIRLTAAGYLPPKVVTAAMDELGWRAKWIGSSTREDTTAPILELRETAQQLKLLRKYRGQLLLTKTHCGGPGRQQRRPRFCPDLVSGSTIGHSPQHPLVRAAILQVSYPDVAQ